MDSQILKGREQYSPQPQKVDFIGVGAEKTGTKWLFSCLEEHPEICVAKHQRGHKETYFFNRKKEIGSDMPEESEYDLYGIEKYFEYFSSCPKHSIKGEFTATYLRDKVVAKRIAKHFPNIKIIICLRNPTDRAYSHFYASHYSGKTDEKKFHSFEEAILNNPEFIRRSMYSEYVEEFFKQFPKKNIHIILYEKEAKSHPAETIKNLYKFLGVDSTFNPPSIFKYVGKTLNKKKKHLYKLFNKKLGFFIARVAQKLFLIEVIVNMQGYFEKRKRFAIQKQIKHLFKNDVKRLEQIIEKDLSDWL